MKDPQQIKWWKYAAWTLPFVALTILIGEILLGFDSYLTAIIISTTFIASTVLWWWWAINKIAVMLSRSEKMQESFKTLSEDIKEVKRDVVNWQRGKQKKN